MLDFQIMDFWNWFEKNSDKLQSDKYAKSLLKKLDETISSWKLCWEIGSGFIKPNSLAISPNGDKELIERTNKIIAGAPQLDSWEFYSFKQRKDNWDKAKLMDSDVKINAEDWTYILLKYQDNVTEILIKADNLKGLSTETKEIAVDLVLTNLLGEELKIKTIDFIDIIDVFDDSKGETKLKYLPAHLDRTQNGA